MSNTNTQHIISHLFSQTHSLSPERSHTDREEGLERMTAASTAEMKQMGNDIAINLCFKVICVCQALRVNEITDGLKLSLWFCSI